ncbi:MAG: hypothetical protein C4519_08845 [Desulfobacteraceae bacterium]|nr:MAG: hypothetical protein C4519_08845 [Desulfobacteraceae bacterium]
MRSGRIRRVTGLTLLSVFLILSACATRNHLIVDYHVPAPSDRISGQTVYLQIKDSRDNPEIFTPAAARQVKGFNNLYNLTLVSAKERIPLGGRDLQGIFLEAFKKRMEQMGAKIAPSESGSAPVFQIVIKTIQIDLQDRKWIAKAGYEANLFLDHQLVARETVTGEAERVRIVGREGADDTLSDIFSEIINRLDIVKLFQQAKLV